MDDRARERLLEILGTVPPLRDIMLSKVTFKVKRAKIRRFLAKMLIETFDDDPNLPTLEWVLTRDAIIAFRNIISRRSAALAGFSFLKYMNDLIHGDGSNSIPKPTPGFFAELDHLIRGISGKADIYMENAPASAKHEGLKAAKLRSADLSRMARTVEKYSARYSTGLDDDAKRRRYKNKLRILHHFNATDFEWTYWKWQVRHIIKDADTLSKLIKLTDEEHEAVELAQKYKIPFGITPYYLSLMDYESGLGRDTAIRTSSLLMIVSQGS